MSFLLSRTASHRTRRYMYRTHPARGVGLVLLVVQDSLPQDQDVNVQDSPR